MILKYFFLCYFFVKDKNIMLCKENLYFLSASVSDKNLKRLHDFLFYKVTQPFKILMLYLLVLPIFKRNLNYDKS